MGLVKCKKKTESEKQTLETPMRHRECLCDTQSAKRSSDRMVRTSPRLQKDVNESEEAEKPRVALTLHVVWMVC